MEILKGMSVLCGDKIATRYAYHLNGNIYIRLGKHWHEASKSDNQTEYQYILVRQLSEMETNILMDEIDLDGLTPEQAERVKRAIDPQSWSSHCPICDSAIEKREQIGTAVFARPCGHWYTGRIPE